MSTFRILMEIYMKKKSKGDTCQITNGNLVLLVLGRKEAKSPWQCVMPLFGVFDWSVILPPSIINFQTSKFCEIGLGVWPLWCKAHDLFKGRHIERLESHASLISIKPQIGLERVMEYQFRPQQICDINLVLERVVGH